MFHYYCLTRFILAQTYFFAAFEWDHLDKGQQIKACGSNSVHHPLFLYNLWTKNGLYFFF
jgi:hypothetical protein